MNSLSRFSLKIVAFLFVFIGLLTWQIEWKHSPLHRVWSWGQLTYGDSLPPQKLLHYAQVLAETESTIPSELLDQLSNYKINATINVLDEKNTEIPYDKTTLSDSNYLEGQQYTYPKGESGTGKQKTEQLLINNSSAGVFILPVVQIKAPQAETVFIGTKSEAELLNYLKNTWKTITSLLNKKDSQALTTYIDKNELSTLAKLSTISDLEYKTGTSPLIKINPTPEESATQIQIATLSIKQSSCSITGVIFVYYQKETHTYTFSNVVPALNALCSKPKSKALGTGLTYLTCKNCWLAPVSKNYSLTSTYIPTVVATGLNGGGYVTSDTKTALIKLFADAKEKGLSPRISSSYRSYTTQQTLFNSYVKNEMSSGKLTQAQAIAKANTYSAKPGQSEHQLGTTVDIVGCPTTCSFYDSRNTPVFNYFKANAYKFGFVISYPNGSQPYTGYVYEPWHLRYVGVTRATELYNKHYLTQTGYYLYHYLLEKGEY